MILARRAFLTGLGATLITAPAIVRAGSLMPVKQMIEIDDGVALLAMEQPVVSMAGLREMLLPGLYEVTGLLYEVTGLEFNPSTRGLRLKS